MTKDGATMEDMEVISVTTGTKCVNGEHMSVNGNSLNGKTKIFIFFYFYTGILTGIFDICDTFFTRKS